MHLGSNDFRTKYLNEKVTEWYNKFENRIKICKITTYAAFCFGEQNKFSCFLRTIPEMKDFRNRLMK